MTDKYVVRTIVNEEILLPSEPFLASAKLMDFLNTAIKKIRVMNDTPEANRKSVESEELRSFAS